MSDLLNQASLVMIPSGYKEDTVYSVVPSDGSGDLSFTRASNGTRINSAGLVEVTPWNDLTYSEDFTNAVWTKITATVTANSTTAPNGTNTATKFESVAAGVPQLSRGITGTNTISIYAKAGNISNFRIWIGSEVIFDLSTGTVLAGTATMENVGNGWYRCIISSTNAGSVNPYFVSTASGQFVYVWGAQLNIGSTAKPYFPTTDRLNVPRLTYQNGGGGCPSLLLEKQSTNLVTYSEQFDNAAWSKNNTTVTANATTSPDGTQNADKLIADNGASLSSISNYALQSITKAASAIQYTFSTFVKQGGLNRINIIAQGASIVNNASATFSLVDGSITTAATAAGAFIGASASVTNYGNGWYRCALVFTTNTDTDLIIRNIPTDSTLTAGNGTNGILIYGAQLEASSYPTSYIPTTSASATRVADACSKTGISSLIGQTSGTAFVDFVYLGGVQAIVMELANSAANDLINVYITSSATTQCYMFDGGSQVGFINSSHTFVQGSRYKIAIGYASNDLVLYINGTQIGTATPSSIAATSEIYISRDKAALYLTDTKYNEVVIFPTRLTNAELASLTTI